MNKSYLRLYFRFYTDWKYFTLNYEDYYCEKYGSNYYKLINNRDLYDFIGFLYQRKYISESFYHNAHRYEHQFTLDIWLEVDGKKCKLLKGDITNKDEMIKEKEFEVSGRIHDYLDKNFRRRVSSETRLKDAKEKMNSVFEYF